MLNDQASAVSCEKRHCYVGGMWPFTPQTNFTRLLMLERELFFDGAA
jgi:hypothetical protein